VADLRRILGLAHDAPRAIEPSIGDGDFGGPVLHSRFVEDDVGQVEQVLAMRLAEGSWPSCPRSASGRAAAARRATSGRAFGSHPRVPPPRVKTA
jgi:hypothetical protein